MVNINIAISDDLHLKIKQVATQKNMKIKHWVIKKLTECVSEKDLKLTEFMAEDSQNKSDTIDFNIY